MAGEFKADAKTDIVAVQLINFLLSRKSEGGKRTQPISFVNPEE